METFVVKGGSYAYGNYPDIDELFDRQTTETDAETGDDPAANAAADGEYAIYAPIWCARSLVARGPGLRVGPD
jgi:hypothetical protein